MALTNPLGLDNAIPFPAWARSDDGLSLLLFWAGSPIDAPVGTLRFHISDQRDALHVLVTRSAEPPHPPRERAEHEGSPMSMTEHQCAEVALPSPLGNRPVVDATAGIARPQVSSGTEFWQRFWVEDVGKDAVREFQRREQLRWPKQHWTYDDEHSVIQFVRPPGDRSESRTVAASGFNFGN